MDFDLFELEEFDDELLNSVSVASSQRNIDRSRDCIPEFQCGGEDSLLGAFPSEGFVKNGFTDNDFFLTNLALDKIRITKYNFNFAHLSADDVINFIISNACTNIQMLMAGVNTRGTDTSDSTYYQKRRHVTLLLYMLLHSARAEHWPQLSLELEKIRTLINNCIDTEAWRQLYYRNSIRGNECTEPKYHLLHGILEWRLLDMCLVYKFCIDRSESKTEDIDEAFFTQLERIYDDLILCSLYHYVNKNTTDLLYHSPFPCICFKEFWVLLQLLLDKWYNASLLEVHKEKFEFWNIFNKIMNNYKTKLEIFKMGMIEFTQFCNWMLHGIVKLYGYKPNGDFEGSNSDRVFHADNSDFCEANVQLFLNSNPNEEQLRIYICLLTPTLLEWWRPKASIPMILWEYFHKRLNSTFYVAGAPPSDLAVACSTGKSYLEKYRLLLEKQQPDANLCSYTLFTLLLGKSLERFERHNLSNQSQKLLGRIFSKFTVQKFLTLSEMGIHHLIELFLVLALKGEFGELAPKLRDKLLSIALEKIMVNKQVTLTKGHMALLTLHAEKHCDMSDYVTKLLEQLQSVSNDVSVSKIIADSLLDIFVHANDFQRGEYLLIGSWLPCFLSKCTPSEQERTLEALHLIFMKIQEYELFLDSNKSMFKSLTTHILPFIREHYCTDYSNWLPILAADFCSQLYKLDVKEFHKTFNYFIDASTSNREAVPKYLVRIWKTHGEKLSDEQDKIIKIWLKYLVLLTMHNEEVVNLTNIVAELSIFQSITNLQPSDLLTAKDPLPVFISAVGRMFNSSTDYRKRCTIADKFNIFVSNFEKWLQPELSAEKTEVVFRYYSFIAIVIYNCSQIVYTKSKITCFFHIAMTRFVLPTSIQMGKPPEGKLSQIVHKIWPIIAQGIGRLNFRNDPYINKALSDLIQKWTPHLNISSNSKLVARPFIACLQSDNNDLSLFIFEKLTNMFLATQRRQADRNACFVITIYQEVVGAFSTATTGDVDENEIRLETFMKGTCFAMLEHIMMVDEIVPSRSLLLDLFKRLLNCEIYRRSRKLPDLMSEHLKLITKKHLAYYTFFYFELMTKIAEISYELVENMLDFVKAEVIIVEDKRGAGEDNRIRGCLQKLERAVRLGKLAST